jgi:DNA-binding transcriptional regulator LsrR (DeoR family)
MRLTKGENMAAQSKMRQIETEYGRPIEEVLEQLYAQYRTQNQVAQALGISQGTLSTWLLKLGYRQIAIIKKEA